MDTKIRGDIAEYAVIHALKRGLGMLQAVEDRLPDELVFYLDGTLFKIQVKYTWELILLACPNNLSDNFQLPMEFKTGF
jgi:PD-(D/E)XK endonuclease